MINVVFTDEVKDRINYLHKNKRQDTFQDEDDRPPFDMKELVEEVRFFNSRSVPASWENPRTCKEENPSRLLLPGFKKPRHHL